MSLVIYSNGIVEEFLPLNDTFSEEELLKSFHDYTSIESFRLPEIVNTWCIWGHIDNPPEKEYNRIASELVDNDVYSHIIFIHDSEINPSWKLTDDIIYNNYNKFMEKLEIFIHDVIQKITNEEQEKNVDNNASMIYLSAKGHTEDKRVLFVFNPAEQSESFYYDGGFSKLAEKSYEYLHENFSKEPIEENKSFVILSDAKVIVLVEDQNVDKFINDMIEDFMKKEKYEICANLNNIKNEWYKRKTIKNIDPSLGLN